MLIEPSTQKDDFAPAKRDVSCVWTTLRLGQIYANFVNKTLAALIVVAIALANFQSLGCQSKGLFARTGE
jgi:hypothetical protein